jgi:hypothetical protein
MELGLEMESAAAFLNRETIIACGAGKKIKKVPSRMSPLHRRKN